MEPILLYTHVRAGNNSSMLPCVAGHMHAAILHTLCQLNNLRTCR
jgi:hypothetical protein